MVEELIAQGYTTDEVADVLVRDYGMNYGDAYLLIDTALGGAGDVIEDDVAAAGRPDVTELAMVAVYPRPEEQQALAVDGGNEADTMHVTLIFLGDAGEIDDDVVETTLADIGRVIAPLEGQVGGVGLFREGEDGVPVIALPSVVGLAELRALIADALADQGIVSPTEHGWTPHLTIEYVEPGAVDLRAVPDVPLHFDAITYSKGDVRRDFPLEG